MSMFPPEVRTAIANMSFADNAEMALAADKIMEIFVKTERRDY